MDRARAIRLAERWSEGGVCTLRHAEANEYHKLCLAALRAQEQRQWVSVKERLPKGENGSDFCENVIAFTSEGQVTTGWLNGDVWFLLVGDLDHHTKHGRRYVTHWMPLPMPPKEGAEREQEQREQGCEFCLNGEYLSAIFYDKYGDRLDFTFCPMCGRKLKEGADHENP